MLLFMLQRARLESRVSGFPVGMSSVKCGVWSVEYGLQSFECKV